MERRRRETVTRVVDGDTFETAKRKAPIRLSNVDTPEKGTPGFSQAKKALEDMVLGEKVVVTTRARDIYGRSVADVRLGAKSVNKAMKKYEK